MGKVKYSIVIIIMVTIVSISGLTPYITKSLIDQQITQEEKKLNQYGVSLKIISNDGYLNSKREISIEVEDSIKFLDYISNSLNLNQLLLDELIKNKEVLDHISLKGTMLNTNIFPDHINISLLFDKLPKALKEAMKKEPVFNEFMNSFTLNLKLDRFNKIKFASLNDIIIQNKDITAKILKSQIVINNNNTYLTSIENIFFKATQPKEQILFNINKIEDQLHYTDIFNSHEIATIDDIEFQYTNTKSYQKSRVSYLSKDNKMIGNLNSKNDELNISMDYNMGNSSLITNYIDIKVDDFNLKIGINGLKQQPIKTLLDSANFEVKLQEIINYGFTIDLQSTINNIQNNKPNIFNTKHINFNLVTKLKRNILNETSRYNDIEKNIIITGRVQMDKDIINLIPPIQPYNTKIINGLSNFDIKFIDGKLFINGQKVD